MDKQDYVLLDMGNMEDVIWQGVRNTLSEAQMLGDQLGGRGILIIEMTVGHSTVDSRCWVWNPNTRQWDEFRFNGAMKNPKKAFLSHQL